MDTIEISPLQPGLAIAGSGHAAFLSRDSGASWRLIPQLNSAVFDIAFAAGNQNYVLAATQQGLWRSMDAGASWQMLPLSGWVTEVAVDPADERRIFALVGFDTKVLKRSLDGGQTWVNTSVHTLFGPNEILVQAGTGVVLTSTKSGVHRSIDGGVSFTRVLAAEVGELAFAPSQPSDLFVASSNYFSGSRLWRSSDSGATWVEATSLPAGERCSCLAVDPLDAALVYASTFTSGLWRSRDQGSSWELLQADAKAASLSALRVAPWGPGEWYASSGSGAGILASSDLAQPFTERNVGLVDAVSDFRPRSDRRGGLLAIGAQRAYTRQRTSELWQALESKEQPFAHRVTAVAIHPARPERLLMARSEVAELLRSLDGGANWSPLPGPFAGECSLLSYDDFGGLYAAASSGEFAYSVDDGLHWSVTAGAGLSFLELLPDPSQAGRVYAREFTAFFRSDDYGQTWTAGGSDLYGLKLFDLEVDPHTAGALYLVVDTEGGAHKALFVSQDAGQSWSESGQGLEALALLSIAVDPIIPGRILVAGPGAVMQSVDGGASFRALGQGLDLKSILGLHLALDATSPGRAYLNDGVRGSYTIDLGCPEPLAYCTAKTNSLGLQALLRASGSARISSGDFALTVSNGVPHMRALAFASGVGPAMIPVFGGFLCAAPPLQRLGVFQLDASGAALHPLQLDASLLAQRRWYQVFYRDPNHPDGSSFAMTDGLEVLYCE